MSLLKKVGELLPQLPPPSQCRPNSASIVPTLYQHFVAIHHHYSFTTNVVPALIYDCPNIVLKEFCNCWIYTHHPVLLSSLGHTIQHPCNCCLLSVGSMLKGFCMCCMYVHHPLLLSNLSHTIQRNSCLLNVGLILKGFCNFLIYVVYLLLVSNPGFTIQDSRKSCLLKVESMLGRLVMALDLLIQRYLIVQWRSLSLLNCEECRVCLCLYIVLWVWRIGNCSRLSRCYRPFHLLLSPLYPSLWPFYTPLSRCYRLLSPFSHHCGHFTRRHHHFTSNFTDYIRYTLFVCNNQ